MYTSFMAAKSFMSAKYTLYLTTLSNDDPDSSSTSLRFWRTFLCTSGPILISLQGYTRNTQSGHTYRGLLDLSGSSLAGTEDETRNLRRRGFKSGSADEA